MEDLLIEGATEDQVLDKFVLLLQRCRKYNIKISRRKVQFGQIVKFAGLTLGGELGYKPHIEKSEAILNLAPPTSVKEVRSFLGMANSFRNFMPRLSHNLENIRKLLAKQAVFLWTESHQREFEEFKKSLTGPLGLHPFDMNFITQLWVDFSASGMGLVLTQTSPKDEKDKPVIWCDSTSLTPAQSRYISIYGEHTAMVWAIL